MFYQIIALCNCKVITLTSIESLKVRNDTLLLQLDVLILWFISLLYNCPCTRKIPYLPNNCNKGCIAYTLLRVLDCQHCWRYSTISIDKIRIQAMVIKLHAANVTAREETEKTRILLLRMKHKF